MKTLRDKLKETYKLNYAEYQDSAAHKLFFLSPDLLDKFEIRYNIVKQEKGEFLLIFPLSFHQGFNVGLNVAEAINFAKKMDQSWSVVIVMCSRKWMPLPRGMPGQCTVSKASNKTQQRYGHLKNKQ